MSVAVWINDPSRGASRAKAIKEFGDGKIFGFESLPLESTTRQHADDVRAENLQIDGHFNATGNAHDDLAMARAGHSSTGARLVDADCEIADAQLSKYIDDLVTEWVNDGESLFFLRLNIAPHKSVFLPPPGTFFDHPRLSAAIQTYYGNMQGRYSEAQAWGELIFGAHIPSRQAYVVYAAMCAVYVPGSPGRWVRAFTLPSLFEAPVDQLAGVGDGPQSGAQLVDHIRFGPVYNDDLMANAGCWA